MAKKPTGPRGGVTTIAPSGWQKTTVYLRADQVRKLKQAGLDRDRTMSELLRRAIDYYFELPQGDPETGVHRSEAVEAILRERHDIERQEAAATAAVFDGEG